MAFKMNYKNLEAVVKELQGAVKAHSKQAKVIKKHIEKNKSNSPKNFNAGLRAASKAGKLDNNPKFKAAVDNAPTNMSAYKFNKDAVNKARKKRISKRMADPDVSMNKFRRNLNRLRKDKEKGRY